MIGIVKNANLNISWPEFILVLHVNVDEVLLPDGPGQRIELSVKVWDDRQKPGELVVDKVVVVDAVVERVHGQAVQVSSLVLVLADKDGDFVETAGTENVFRRIRQHSSVNNWSEPAREREESLWQKCRVQFKKQMENTMTFLHLQNDIHVI